MGSAQAGHEGSERVRRRVYLIALAGGILILPLVWLLRDADDSFVRFGYPFLLTFLVVVACGLLSDRLPVAHAERLTLAVIAVVYVGRLAALMFTADDLSTVRLELAESTFWNINLLFLFVYLAFDTTRALRSSLAIYGSVVAILALRLLPGLWAGEHVDEAITFLRILVFMAATIALLYGLAHVKGQLAQARAEVVTMARLAFSDALTGLPNRRRLLQILDSRLDEAARYEHDLSVVLLDLDHFKGINDVHGHEVGDLVLRAAGRILAAELRGVDAFGRWGGEEFLIVAVGIRQAEAKELAERCRALLADHNFDAVGRVTASFGVASHQAGDTSRSLLGRADAALYVAKRSGRNRVTLAPRKLVTAAS